MSYALVCFLESTETKQLYKSSPLLVSFVAGHQDFVTIRLADNLVLEFTAAQFYIGVTYEATDKSYAYWPAWEILKWTMKEGRRRLTEGRSGKVGKIRKGRTED